ncbi:hypothetical protein G6730_00035 [Polynucleobacter paneuropaeus]|nr:hypothetical protein [Polynucleobacter paneuropaeus]
MTSNIFVKIEVEARSLLNKALPEKAIALIQKKLKNLNYPFEILCVLAEANINRGDIEKSVHLFRDYLSIGNFSLKQILHTINLYFDRKMYEESLFFIEIGLKAMPLNGILLSKKAEIYLFQNKIDESSELILKKTLLGRLDKCDVAIVNRLSNFYSVNSFSSKSQVRFLSNQQVRDVCNRYVFERTVSLGIDCEFGFVQRIMGKEPMSLFRWGTLPLEKLIELLNERFDGFASDNLCHLELSNTMEHYEYWFHDQTYQMQAHTFYNPKNIDIAETKISLLHKIQAHFLFLARKLEDDLEDCDKIFVYKSRNKLQSSQIDALSGALSKYADNMLLVVMPRLPGEPCFEVLSSSLVIGRICKYWDGASLNSIDVEAWAEILSSTWKYFVEVRPEINLL